MQTQNESYQNSIYCTNIQNLNDIELNDLYHVVYKDLGQAIDNDDLNLHDNILPVLRAIKTEIQTRNEVTPTLTEKQTNIQNTQNLINNLQTQINKVFRSRNRNILFFDYSSFLCRTIKKITPKKHFKNLHNRAEQNSILSVLHKSLIDEQSKLINKHALLVA